MSYAARIARVVTRPHPNADRLQLGTCLGYQVVVGTGVASGTLGVFFPDGGQLSEEYCRANDLLERRTEDGKRAGGYFDAKRRVRSQLFRGERSEGLWMPLDSLAFAVPHGALDPAAFEEGEELTEVNGFPLCCRYETPFTRTARTAHRQKPSRQEPLQFRRHYETHQLRDNLHRIPSGALIVITEKLHGTSHRVGRVQVEAPLHPLKALWNRWAPRALRFRAEKRWVVVHGSRNLVLDDLDSPGNKFRAVATEGIGESLRKGEVLYGEIVGYSGPTKPIMGRHDTKRLASSAIRDAYPPVMTYAYGLPPGRCQFHVYRIVQTTEDGDQVEMSWLSVCARCAELGLSHVPQLAAFVCYDDNPSHLVKWEADLLADGPSLLDPNHIREGVCVRVESGAGAHVYKHKSFNFGVLEGYLRDDDTYTDAEEAA